MYYLNSLYDGDIAFRESVLFIKDENGKARAGLLHEAKEVIKAENINGKVEWVNGKDFTVDGSIIKLCDNTSVPCFDFGFPKAADAGQDTGFKHVGGGVFRYFPDGLMQENQMFITYKIKKRSEVFRHEKSPFLPNFDRLISEKKPIKMLIYGDSISAGRDAAPDRGKYGYFPHWSGQLKELMEKNSDSEISLINTAVGGKAAKWGLEEFDGRVKKHDPDLLILGFGMNDGTGRVETQEFIRSIKAMLEKLPDKTDTVLISTMLPNPKAVTMSGDSFFGYQKDYRSHLRQLTGGNVDMFDMTEIHEDILRRKKPEDMLENNINHPNDYLSRWYAQGLFKLIMG